MDYELFTELDVDAMVDELLDKHPNSYVILNFDYDNAELTTHNYFDVYKSTIVVMSDDDKEVAEYQVMLTPLCVDYLQHGKD